MRIIQLAFKCAVGVIILVLNLATPSAAWRLLDAPIPQIGLPLADQGDARAQADLGRLYAEGKGGPPDYAKAMEWYRKAADQGDARAQADLGRLYAEGKGVPQDYAKAVEWYRKAADQGDARAQADLGRLYAEGKGVPQDYAKAMEWYRKAADQGDARAQADLGRLYAEGEGVPQDYAKAMEWYRKAADQGITSSQYRLGRLYTDGHGVADDRAKAEYWLRKAAEGGDFRAQSKLSPKQTITTCFMDISGHRYCSEILVEPSPQRASAYWNTWFENQDAPAPVVLTLDRVYTFVLDLSPYEYTKLGASDVQSAGVDPSVERALSDDPQRRRLTFQVRPLLPEGGGLSFGPSVRTDTIPLKANLERIRKPNVAEAQRYVAGDTSLFDLSKNVAADSVRFDIHTEAAGCSAVVLSILSEDGRFPLDHLVRWVAIARPGDAPPTCGTQISGVQQQLHGGLGTLLEVSLQADSARTSQSAAAAFHIFDTSAGSFVVFSDGRPNQTRSVYAWQTLDSLVRYVKDEHRLPRLIKSARAAAADGKPSSYVEAAQELAALLFTGKGESANEANLAKAALQEIVEQSSTRPVIVARVVSDIQQGQNRSVFLPLGILAAKGDGAVLKRPITVMQPLPRERYTPKKTCIGDWTFGFPNKLESVTEDLKKLEPKISFGNWFHDLAGLRSYLAETSPVKDSPAQGFLLLAHQGSGNLWFEDEAKRVIRQNITRNYPPGSAGVFAACSFAAPSYDSGFVQQFNERGIDAIIASPFSVPATYGARLAAEFPQALEAMRQADQTPTISDLFAAAIDRTARRLEQDFSGKYEEMGLEYVLLGNPNIVLCHKTE